jgi:hypothetical protein
MDKEEIIEINESIQNYLNRHYEILGYVERGCKPGRNDILPLDEYSNILRKSYSDKIGYFYEYVGCGNNNLICEDSWNRVISVLKDEDWAIVSAYRKQFTLRQNIQRNRVLRGMLNGKKAGVHQLVGHWREAPDGMEYKEAETKGLLEDTIERSYLVARPKSMEYEDFKTLIASLLTIEGVTQDCCMIHRVVEGEIKHPNSLKVTKSEYYLLYPNRSIQLIGTNLTPNKIAQAYSQYVRKLSVPFVFEGVETPSSIGGNRMFQSQNIKYLIY